MRDLLVQLGADEIIKEAMIGMAAGLMARAGKVVVKNPWKVLGASDVMSGASRLSQKSSVGHNMGLQAPVTM